MSDPLDPQEAATLFYSGHPMSFVGSPDELFVCGQYQGQLALITKIPFNDMEGATAYFTDNPVTLAAPPIAPSFITAPVLTALSPDNAPSGGEDITLSCIGSGFTSLSVIVFGQEDEPTTWVSETEVTTVVKPSLFVPAVIPVTVSNAGQLSAPVNFTMTEPEGRETPEQGFRPQRPQREHPMREQQPVTVTRTRTVVHRG